MALDDDGDLSAGQWDHKSSHDQLEPNWSISSVGFLGYSKSQSYVSIYYTHARWSASIEVLMPEANNHFTNCGHNSQLIINIKLSMKNNLKNLQIDHEHLACDHPNRWINNSLDHDEMT